MNFWDERYKEKEYVYGVHPNEFFENELNKLPNGILVLPCEGEGRNAVFAAKKGWKVYAYDSSIEGKNKALQLAEKENTSIQYDIIDALHASYESNSIDCIAFIYAHFPSSIRSSIHQMAINWLKPGGTFILEAFRPEQLSKNSGGPKDLDLLYDEAKMIDDFNELIDLTILSKTLELKEGKFHNGEAEIIRVIGKKK